MSKNTILLNSYRRQTLFWGSVVFGTGILIWVLRPVLTPFLLGGLIAYVLQPGVEWLVRKRVPRGFAALAMMVLFASLIASIVLLVLAVIQREGPEIQMQIPAVAAKLSAWLQPKLGLLGFRQSFDLADVRTMLISPLEGSGQAVALAVWRYLRTGGNVMITVVGNVVLVPLVLFYLLYDRHQMFARMESLVPRRWLAKMRELVTEMDQILSQYLRGQMLVMAVLAAFYPVALTIAGFEIALPLGIVTGLAVFIPYVGFATGLALALLAALLQFGTCYGFCLVAVVYGTGQILESFFLTPRFIGERIGLHPLAVVFALLAFGQLFGFFGVLLALPVSAMLATALRELRRCYLTSALYEN